MNEFSDATPDSVVPTTHSTRSRVIIVRHGNTFDKHDIVTRVGARTDLPLSSSGIKQAKRLGRYLREHHQNISQVFTSRLKRTQQTAQIALADFPGQPPLTPSREFDEIDYGPDENQPEAQVIARIGQEALDAWEQDSIAPPGWKVNPTALIQSWQDFFQKILLDFPEQTILVVTSNGIARFAPFCLHQSEQWRSDRSLKMATGSLSEFYFEHNHWLCDLWNHRPPKKKDDGR